MLARQGNGPSVCINVKPRYRDYRFLLWHQRNRRHRWAGFGFASSLILALIIVSIVNAMSVDQIDIEALMVWYYVTFMASFMIIGMLGESVFPFLDRRRWRSNLQLCQPFVITVSTQGVAINQDQSVQFIVWQDIALVEKLDSFVAVTTCANVSWLIPEGAFADGADRRTFQQLTEALALESKL